MGNVVLDKFEEFAFGKVDKAIILLHEKGDPELEPKDPVQPKSKGGFGGGIDDMSPANLNDVSKMAGNSGLKEPLKTQVGNLASGLSGKMTGLRGNIAYNKEFEVQFNPSSLRISSQRYEEEDVTKVNGAGGAADISKGANYPYMELHVTLVFERIIPNEAFVNDSSFANLTTAMQSAYNAILKKVGKQSGLFESRSVQAMVEGFTAAIRKENTREVAFCWSSMIYEGVLKNVRSTYTMFDLHGRPIRGEVALTILLSDTEINSTNMGYWMEAYDSAFGYKEQGVFGKVKGAMDTVGNVVDTVAGAAAQVANTAKGIAGLGLTLAGAIQGAIDEATSEEVSDSDKVAKRIQKKQDSLGTKQQERKFTSGRKNDVNISLTEDKRDEAEKTREEERDEREQKAREAREAAEKKAEEDEKTYYNVDSEEVSRETRPSDDDTDDDTDDSDDDDDNNDPSTPEPAPAPEEPDTRTPAEKERDEAKKAKKDADDAVKAAEEAVKAAEDKVKEEQEKVDKLKQEEAAAQKEYFEARDAEDAAREARDKAETAQEEAQKKFDEASEKLEKLPENDPGRAAAEQEKTAAKTDLDSKNEALETAKKDLDEKEKTAKEKLDAYNTSTHVRLEGEVELGKAKDNLDYAKYVTGTSKREAEEAKDRYEKAETAYDEEQKGQKTDPQQQEEKPKPSINEMIKNSQVGGGIKVINPVGSGGISGGRGLGGFPGRDLGILE